jgi:deoxyribonuclease V
MLSSVLVLGGSVSHSLFSAQKIGGESPRLTRLKPEGIREKAEEDFARAWIKGGILLSEDHLVIPSQHRIDGWRTVQRELAKKVIRRDSFTSPPKLVAGVDVAYREDRAFSAAAVLNYETLQLVEAQVAISIVKVPYVASFFAFREVEPLIKVIRMLKKRADIFLVNAHGVAHPERCGSASHLGVVLDIPTIGVASRALCGKVSESEDGEIRYLRDRDEVIGAALYVNPRMRPVYVSIGHKVSFESAIEIVLRTVRENRMPEPLRIAHSLSNEARKKCVSK